MKLDKKIRREKIRFPLEKSKTQKYPHYLVISIKINTF